MGQKLVPPIKPPVHMERLYDRRMKGLILDPTYRHYNSRLIKTNSYAQALKVLDSKAYTPPSLATGEARLAVTQQVNQLNTLHKTELIRKFQGALGVDVSPLLNDPKVRLYLQKKVVENVDLIKTISPRFHASLANKLSGMAAAGKIFDRQAVRKLLAEEYGSSGYNLRRLTRDQTSKMVGNLTKQRHGDLGVKKYQWFTAGDERVRDSHRNNEGGTFFWNKPPPDTGHPGEDIQCRCSAVAILDTTTQKQIQERAAAAQKRLRDRPLGRVKVKKPRAPAKYKSVNMNKPTSYSPFDPGISPEARNRAFEYRLTSLSKERVSKNHSKIKTHVPDSAVPKGLREFEAWQHEFVNDFLSSPNRSKVFKSLSKKNQEMLQRILYDMDEVTKPLADDFVLYRGMENFNPKHSYLDDLVEGKVATSRGYLQTARDLEFPAEMYSGGNLPKAQRGVNALFEIKAPKGTQAIVHGEEGHVMLGRGTKLRVKSVQRNVVIRADDTTFRYDYIYQLEVIPGKKPPPIFKPPSASKKITRRLKEIDDTIANEKRKVKYYEDYLKTPKSQQTDDWDLFVDDYKGYLKTARDKIAKLQREADKLKG